MKWLISCVLLVLACACSNKPMPDYETLSRSTSQPPYLQTVEMQPYQLDLKYRPDWILAGEELIALRKSPDLSLEKVAALMETYKGAVTFVLKVGPHSSVPKADWPKTDIVNHHPNLPSFSSNLHHLIYGLDEKIYLLAEDGARVPVSLYQLDRNWGITSSNRFLITFPMTSGDWDLRKDGNIEVVFQNLHPMLPEVRFKFPTNPIREGHYTPAQILESLQMWNPDNKTGAANAH